MDALLRFFFKYGWLTFAKGQLGLAHRPAWWMLALLLAAVAGLVWFLYLRPGYRMGRATRWELVLLRGMLLGILLLMIMRPVVVVPSVIPRSSSVAIVADDSRSMQLTDERERRRMDVVREMLEAGSPFAQGMEEKFRVRLYGFGGKAERINSAGSLKGEGAATDPLGGVLESVRDSGGANLAAVVLISDGGANTTSDQSEELRQLRSQNIPVFTIGVGNPGRFRDLEVTRVSVPRRVLIGSAVSAEVYLRLSGYAGSSRVEVAVTEDGRPLKSQSFDLRPGGENREAQPVTVEFTPSAVGFHRYGLKAAPLEAETTVENNEQESLIEVTNNGPKVLYIEGEPRWEYGKIRFSLSKNEKNLTLVSVLRSADGKFYRQGVGSGAELASGFPGSIEELFGYQGLMLGSIEAGFFSYDQLRLIEQFAAKRGGGILMMGGGRSLSGGRYANTPVAEMLPVVVGEAPESPAGSGTAGFKARLTAAGRTHAVTRLNEDRAASAKAWEEMPAITIPERLTRIKPGATTILEATTVAQGGEAVPMLVEQRYGRGRSLALLASDTWRWRMELPSQNSAHETFWRQMLRYLVSLTPEQFAVASERDVYAIDDTVTVRAEVNDRKFDPVTDARVTAVVTRPNGEKLELPLEIDYSRQMAAYSGRVTATESGIYGIEMTAKRGGTVLGTSASSFLVSERSREFFNAAQNVDLMKRIAAETGGKYYPIAESQRLLEEIGMLEGKNSERVSRDLWDMPINFLLLIGLASAEWFLRKRQGLA